MPLSEVIVWGTPNLVIQVEQNASVQAEAVVEDRGTASAHRVVRSTMVKMCVFPCEGGSGPTISTCTCEKQRSGRYGRSWRCDVFVNFGFLARHTLVRPNGDISGHMGPDKPRGKQATRGSNTRVA